MRVPRGLQGSLGPGRGPTRPDCTVGVPSGPTQLSRAPSSVPSWHRLVLLDTVVRPHLRKTGVEL